MTIAASTKKVSSASAYTGPDPILIDLGKQSRKKTRRLRKGRGGLMRDVGECIDELRQEGKINGEAQPVIVVVRQKRRRSSALRW